LLDFIMIRRLAAAALARRVPIQHVVAMALLKSVICWPCPRAHCSLPGSLA